MANVVFKRGSQSSLNDLKSYVDGGFYLTSDTNRLYVAQSSSKLVELNKSITVVTNVNQLPSSTTDTSKEVKGNEVEVGQFYYVNAGSEGTKGNILAVCTNISNGTITWTQVNPDTYENTYATALSVSGNKAEENDKTKLVYDITLSQSVKTSKSGGATSLNDVVGTLTINASDLAKVTVDIAVDIGSSAVSNNSTTIKTAGLGSSGSGFTITGGDDIKLSGSANALTISGNSQKVNAVSVDSDGKISITVKDSDNVTNTITSGNDPVVYNKITIDGTEYTIKNQQSLGSFYSASKVDNLIVNAKKTIDAMTYKGAIASKTALDALENVQRGDVYKASSAFSIGSINVKIGDLIIFNADDDSAANVNANWDVISSGGEADTTYTLSASDNSIVLTPSTGGSQTIALSGDSHISVSGGSSGIAVTHSNITGLTAGSYGLTDDITGLTAGDTFTVPGFTVDAAGHVTLADNFTVQLPADSDSTYSIANPAISVSNNVANLTTTLTGSGSAQGATSTSSFAIKSNSLDISASGTNLSLDLSWGTF